MGLEGQPEREIRCGGTRPNTDQPCKAFLTAVVLDGAALRLRFFCRRCRSRSHVTVTSEGKLYLKTTPLLGTVVSSPEGALG